MTAPIRAIGLAALALAGCTLGPNYHRPDIPTPASYSEPAPTATAAEADLSRWWTGFGDPVLHSLVERALAANLDLAAAASRVRQSRFEEKATGAAEWPAINAAANTVALRSNRSTSQTNGPPTGFQLPSSLNLYSVGFDATWEVDLFGGTRRAVQEAKANSEAAVWARRDGEVSLVAEVANDYLTLRAVQARIAVGEGELARQKDLFTLVSARRQAGFVTGLDVNQQTAQVATAAAQIHQLEAEERVQIHALAVLLAEPPETLEPTLARRGEALPPPPPSLPTGLPSELLHRRPDIREAERRLAAANAEIGVQTANLYPRLNLIGLGSFAGTSLGDLFSAQDLSGVGVGLLTAPLFNAGKTHAAIGAAKEKAAQAQLAYRGAVLTALREVEDALARYRTEEARRAQLERAVSAAEGSLGIAKDQYSVGLVTYINIYAAENAVLNARDQLVQSQAQSATDLVALYKALGGGWSG